MRWPSSTTRTSLADSAQVAVADLAGHPRAAGLERAAARPATPASTTSSRTRSASASTAPPHALRRAASRAAADHLLRCGPAADPEATAALREAAAAAAPRAAAAYLERALLERAEATTGRRCSRDLAVAAFHAGLPDPRARLLQALAERPDRAHPRAAGCARGRRPARPDALRRRGRPQAPARRAGHASGAPTLRGGRVHRAWRETGTGRSHAATCAALAREAARTPSEHRHGGARADADRPGRRRRARDRRLRETAGDSIPLRAAAAWSRGRARAPRRPARRGRGRGADRAGRAARRRGASAAEVLALALVERGALAEAREVLDGASRLRHARARLLLAEGDYEAAAAEAREAGRRCLAHGRRNPAWLPWRATLALALAHLGRLDEAAAVADEEVGLARAFGAPTALARALHARTVSPSPTPSGGRASPPPRSPSSADRPCSSRRRSRSSSARRSCASGRRVEARDGLRRGVRHRRRRGRRAAGRAGAPRARRLGRAAAAGGDRGRRGADAAAAADLRARGWRARATARSRTRCSSASRPSRRTSPRAYGTLGRARSRRDDRRARGLTQKCRVASRLSRAPRAAHRRRHAPTLPRARDRLRRRLPRLPRHHDRQRRRSPTSRHPSPAPAAREALVGPRRLLHRLRRAARARRRARRPLRPQAALPRRRRRLRARQRAVRAGADLAGARRRPRAPGRRGGGADAGLARARAGRVPAARARRRRRRLERVGGARRRVRPAAGRRAGRAGRAGAGSSSSTSRSARW